MPREDKTQRLQEYMNVLQPALNAALNKLARELPEQPLEALAKSLCPDAPRAKKPAAALVSDPLYKVSPELRAHAFLSRLLWLSLTLRNCPALLAQAAAPTSEFAAAAPQMSTIDQRVTGGDGMFGGVTSMPTQYGAQPAGAAPMPQQMDQFGAAPSAQFGGPPPAQFTPAPVPAPAPVFAPTSQVPAPVPAPAPVSSDPWDNMFAGGAAAPGDGGGSAI